MYASYTPLHIHNTYSFIGTNTIIVIGKGRSNNIYSKWWLFKISEFLLSS